MSLPNCYRCQKQPTPHGDCGCTDGCCLLLGDCREILPKFSGVDAQSLITDPPYGIVNSFGSNEGRGTRVLEWAWDKPEGIREGIREGIKCLYSTASAFVFTGFDTAEIGREELRSAGFTVKPAAWVKECPPPSGHGNWWASAFELAMYAYRKSPSFLDDDPKRSNVFVCDSYRYGQPGKVDHPTQKPLELMKRIVRSLVPETALCVDPFAGSGTTLVAAKLLGRRAIGIEIEEKYCRIAAQRLRQSVLFGIESPG